MGSRPKITKRTFWTIVLVFVVVGFAMGLAYNAPLIVSVGIGVAGGLVMLVIDRLLNRKKATA